MDKRILRPTFGEIKRKGLVGIAILSVLMPSLLFAAKLAVIVPGRDTPKHNLNEEKAQSVDGALGQKAWKLWRKNDKLAFTVRCDPQKQNYVTVRFWSEDNGSKFSLTDKDGKRLASIDHPTSGNIAPEQWYFSTPVLPRKLTEGKQNLRLQLKNEQDKASTAVLSMCTAAGSAVPTAVKAKECWR